MAILNQLISKHTARYSMINNFLRAWVACLAIAYQASPALAIDYGTPVADGEYASVGLVTVRLGDDHTTLGTGTLIRRNIVLTAAHVIQDAPTPGHISFRTTLGSGQEFQARAVAYRTHPGYLNLRSDSTVGDDERTFMDTDMLSASASDLALLLLDQPAPEKVSLPKLANEAIAAKAQATVIGYGLDEGKRTGPPRKLQGTLQFLKQHESALLFRTPKDSKQRTDHGDSGGPLFVQQNGQEQIVAITHGFYTSAKVEGLSPDEYGIYVSVADHRQWVDLHTEELRSYKLPPAPAFYLSRSNRRTPFLALTARQLFSLANAETPVERLIGRAFSRGINEPIPGDIATGWQKRYRLPPETLVPVLP